MPRTFDKFLAGAAFDVSERIAQSYCDTPACRRAFLAGSIQRLSPHLPGHLGLPPGGAGTFVDARSLRLLWACPEARLANRSWPRFMDRHSASVSDRRRSRGRHFIPPRSAFDRRCVSDRGPMPDYRATVA